MAATAQHSVWTEEEDCVLRSSYVSLSWEELSDLLPGRVQGAIYKRAFRLGLDRRKRHITEDQRESLIARIRENPPRLGKGIATPIFVRDGVAGKACVKCLEWKPLEKFGYQKTCVGGRRNICTTCEGRLAYAGNREKRIATVRWYQRMHPEETREIKRAANRRRHGRKIRGAGVTARQWREIRAAFEGKCAYCGASADTMDHVIPLSHGGQHEPGNVVPACKRCNFRKHTKCVQPERRIIP